MMTQRISRSLAAQRGLSLIELLVGIALGLLTVAVAIGALLISRTISSTVSDTAQLQQQAAHAFRVMGRQIRQAGSLRLNMATADPADPVAFELKTGAFDAAIAMRGLDNPGKNQYALTVSYTNSPEPVYSAASDATLLADCLGQQPKNQLVQSAFVLSVDDKDPSQRDLKCKGSGDGGIQPIVQNVAEFAVRYLLQTDSATTGSPLIQYVNAQTVGANWASVAAVEVCLVLYGNEAIDMPDGSTYIGCDGSAVDMTKAAAPQTKRMHMAFRNVYQLRSQGATGGY